MRRISSPASVPVDRSLSTRVSNCAKSSSRSLSGVLGDGERLPSVRELAMELTINPNTIQRAYRELEVQGWIASVPGKGSFVCGIPAAPTAQQRTLLEQFDKTAAALLRLGITREALMARLEKGE